MGLNQSIKGFQVCYFKKLVSTKLSTRSYSSSRARWLVVMASRSDSGNMGSDPADPAEY